MSVQLVHPIGVRNLKNVPESLHKLAGDLESGKFNHLHTAVVILCADGGEPFIYAYGERASPLEAAGWIARAQSKITQMRDVSRAVVTDPVS